MQPLNESQIAVGMIGFAAGVKVRGSGLHVSADKNKKNEMGLCMCENKKNFLGLCLWACSLWVPRKIPFLFFCDRFLIASLFIASGQNSQLSKSPEISDSRFLTDLRFLFESRSCGRSHFFS